MTIHTPPPIELKGDNDDTEAGLVTKALDGFRDTVTGLLDASEKKAATRLDQIEARLNRPATSTGEKSADVEKKAFGSYLRRGVELMGADEQKALVVGTDAAGGYLAPDEFGKELLKKLVEFSPIRQYARVITTSAPEIKYPRRLTGTTATWTAENTNRTESEPTFEHLGITPYELSTFTEVSQALLEDNAYNLESELAQDFAEQFGATEGLAFVKGVGGTQPKGLMNATGIAEVKTGNATGFNTVVVGTATDTLVDMFHKLPAAHAQRGVWLMNRNTLATIRKFKDASGNHVVIGPLADGMPMTLLGRPIVEAIDMDDIGANKYPILFGNMAGYRIVDRVSMNTLRDPYSKATKGLVVFHARKRVGADVTNPDYFVKLKVAV